ncbi:hypothetical protein HY029_03200 [Candidatus Gottesmanbacteria bacterium]|nr:hypothetical protein [Candidatus Gottesmanbacteria bacterium]
MKKYFLLVTLIALALMAMGCSPQVSGLPAPVQTSVAQQLAATAQAPQGGQQTAPTTAVGPSGAATITPFAVVRYQTPIQGQGDVPAGKVFFAIKTKDLGNGFQSLVYATNGDGCDPSPYQFKLDQEPGADLNVQYSDCERGGVTGKGRFVLTIKNNPPGNPKNVQLNFRVGGANGEISVDGAPMTAFTKDVPVTLDPSAERKFTVSINTGGNFFIQRTPEQLTAGGNYEMRDVGGNGKVLVRSSLGGPNCAWSAEWNVEADSGVQVDWPVCVQLNLTGKGNVKIKVWPRDNEGGYKVANIAGNGLAFWPMGSGATMDVRLKSGTLQSGIPLKTAADGIDFPLAGGPREFVIHLNGGKAEIPLGMITRDLSTPGNPLVLPLY